MKRYFMISAVLGQASKNLQDEIMQALGESNKEKISGLLLPLGSDDLYNLMIRGYDENTGGLSADDVIKRKIPFWHSVVLNNEVKEELLELIFSKLTPDDLYKIAKTVDGNGSNVFHLLANRPTLFDLVADRLDESQRKEVVLEGPKNILDQTPQELRDQPKSEEDNGPLFRF